MEIRKLSDLFQVLKDKPVSRLVVANAVDKHSFMAVHKAVEMGFIQAILTGDKDQIIALCKKNGIDPSTYDIRHAGTDKEAAMLSLQLITQGEADIVMKGLVSTDTYMRALLNKEFGILPPKGILSHITVIENPNYHKLLVVSDVAVIPYPDLNQKVALTNYLVNTAKSMGIEQPKVAVIAATEQVLPAIPACTEAAILTQMNNRGSFKGAIVDEANGFRRCC